MSGAPINQMSTPEQNGRQGLRLDPLLPFKTKGVEVAKGWDFDIRSGHRNSVVAP